MIRPNNRASYCHCHTYTRRPILLSPRPFAVVPRRRRRLPPCRAVDLWLCLRAADVDSRRRLRSASTAGLFIPTTRLSSVDDRAFHMAAARTLNSSPPNVMLSHTHTHTHNFIHLWEKAAQLYAKNESENLTNQQHKTLKRYLAQSAQ